MVRRTSAILCFALALGACGSETTDASAPAEEASAPPTPTFPPVPEPPSEAITRIPQGIQGRWGLVAGDCTSDRGDAKGLLRIGPDTLRFYESVGKLGKIHEAGENRIRATFAFTGEGMNWSRDELLDLQDEGRALVRREYGEDAMPGPLRYMRCG